MLKTFSLARYQFNFKIQQKLHLPDYAGSTLRGVFGHALREISCTTDLPNCKSCPLQKTCPHALIFDPLPTETKVKGQFSEIPHGYSVEPPLVGGRTYQEGEIVRFHFVLIGKLQQYLPFIVLAWQKAFQKGVGKLNGTGVLLKVHYCEENQNITIYDIEEDMLQDHSEHMTITMPTHCSNITLNFLTPLRLNIKKNNQTIKPQDLTSRDLLMTLVRRVHLLTDFYTQETLTADFTALAELAENINSEKNLHWQEGARYSNRQHKTIPLGGLIGQWQLTGNLTPFIPYLYLGQWLHIGKGVTSGLGQYNLLNLK